MLLRLACLSTSVATVAEYTCFRQSTLKRITISQFHDCLLKHLPSANMGEGRGKQLGSKAYTGIFSRIYPRN